MRSGDVIPLSFLDAAFVGAASCPIEFVFTYQKGLQRAALQRGLDQVLCDFPALTCAVELEDASQRWVFAPRAQPPLIEERGADDAPLASVVTLPGEPLLRIVLRREAERDTLGVSMSHAVADGAGYLQLLCAWSAALRGEPYPRPDHDRAAVDALAQREEAARDLTPDSFFDRTGISWLPHLHRDRLGGVTFLRERVPPPSPVVGASESAVLAAACLRRWVSQRGGARSVRIACAVDLRRRAAGISPRFFGNASYGASRRWSRAEYDQTADADVARQLYQSVQRSDRATAQRALSTLRALLLREGPGVAAFLHPADPAQGILVTDLSRLPLTSLDLGVGPPLDFAIVTRAPNAVVVTASSGALYQTTCAADGVKGEAQVR